MNVYLDHNATTPPDPAVVEAVGWALREAWGNPSTLYSEGKRAWDVLRTARRRVAALIGAKNPDEVVFTSGGTEGNNLALLGVFEALGVPDGHVICSMAEHKAVLQPCNRIKSRGGAVTFLPVDGLGRVDPDGVKRAITERTVLVSVMLANNEVGSINSLPDIAGVCGREGILLHTDAVQATGRIPVDVERLGVDLLTLSGHKIYGPRGVGALWVREGTALRSVLSGGTQERGIRPGTENVAGAHGLGVAANLAAERMERDVPRLRTLRDRLWSGIRERIRGVRSHGDLGGGLPNTLSVSFPGWEAEALVLALAEMGIAVGTGSACTTGDTRPSHVLQAMGVSLREARGALRFSLGRENTREEIDATATALIRLGSVQK